MVMYSPWESSSVNQVFAEVPKGVFSKIQGVGSTHLPVH